MKINNGKNKFGPRCRQFLGGSSAASPLKILDVMPPYLKTLFEQKTKMDNYDHFRLNDPLKYYFTITLLFLIVCGHNRVWAQTCLGTNVCGHNRVWVQTCVGTIVCGHKRVWAQSCAGTIVCGHNRVWAQSCVDTIVCGHNRVWAQTCLGTIVCGHKRVWAQSCLGTNVSRHNRVWAQSCGLNDVWAQSWWNQLIHAISNFLYSNLQFKIAYLVFNQLLS